MKDARDCINMTEIRTAIDSIDNQIVELIASRSKYVKEAAKFKKDEKRFFHKKSSKNYPSGGAGDILFRKWKWCVE